MVAAKMEFNWSTPLVLFHHNLRNVLYFKTNILSSYIYEVIGNSAIFGYPIIIPIVMFSKSGDLYLPVVQIKILCSYIYEVVDN